MSAAPGTHQAGRQAAVTCRLCQWESRADCIDTPRLAWHDTGTPMRQHRQRHGRIGWGAATKRVGFINTAHRSRWCVWVCGCGGRGAQGVCVCVRPAALLYSGTLQVQHLPKCTAHAPAQTLAHVQWRQGEWVDANRYSIGAVLHLLTRPGGLTGLPLGKDSPRGRQGLRPCSVSVDVRAFVVVAFPLTATLAPRPTASWTDSWDSGGLARVQAGSAARGAGGGGAAACLKPRPAAEPSTPNSCSSPCCGVASRANASPSPSVPAAVASPPSSAASRARCLPADTAAAGVAHVTLTADVVTFTAAARSATAPWTAAGAQLAGTRAGGSRYRS